MSEISDEMLMAFADGQLSAEEAARVEAAIANDPALAARVATHRATRTRVASAFAPVMSEQVPDRLSALLSAPANVVDLGQARAKKRVLQDWGAREWGAMAASLAAGLLIATILPRGGLVRESDGRVLASGALDRALTQSVGGTENRVAIIATFKAKDGAYCRTFAVESQAGLACRDRGAWEVRAMARAETTLGIVGAGPYRTAGGAIPQEINDLVDRTIEGDALDADAVKAAQAKNWRK